MPKFFQRAVSFLLPFTLLGHLIHATATAAPDERPWYQKSLVGMEVGPTGAQFGSDPSDVGYAKRFNGAEIVRAAVQASSEYLVIWARDGEYAYYDSKVAPKCPGLATRDVLRETVNEAKKYKLPIIAYCVIQGGGDALRKHPEWEMRDHKGNRIGRFCLNSGYLEYMKQLTSEMLAYGIAGFHLDMVDQGFGPPYGCWCDTCKKEFATQFGHPMPNGPSWDATWDEMLEFRYNSSARFELALRNHIRTVAPKATVDYNYHGNPPFSFEVGQRPVQHASNGDFVTGETGVWGFSALAVGLNARFYAAATPGLPVQVAMQRGVRMYHDQTTRPLNDIRWELFTLLAHGSFVTMVDKTGYDGWLDPLAYHRIGLAFKEARSKRQHFGQKLSQEMGIYYSSRTRDWVGREKPATYQAAFNGAHRAVVYEHIPYAVVLDENATLPSLSRLPVVLLPNASILSAKEVALLKAYVTGGGKLIVTGWTGQMDRLGAPQMKTDLEELIGGRLIGRLESRDNHVRFESGKMQSLLNGIPSDWPFLVEGPACVYQPTTGTPFGKLLRPHWTVRQTQGKEGLDWPMSAGDYVGPAVLVNRVGKGQVLTFACSPDVASSSEHPVVEARKLLSNAIRTLNPASMVRVTAPVNVESVVTDDKATRTIRVHLLGYNAPATPIPNVNRPYVLPGLIEDAPMYRASVRLSVPIKSASAFGTGTTVTQKGSTVELVVNDIHEVLVIRY